MSGFNSNEEAEAWLEHIEQHYKNTLSDYNDWTVEGTIAKHPALDFIRATFTMTYTPQQ